MFCAVAADDVRRFIPNERQSFITLNPGGMARDI